MIKLYEVSFHLDNGQILNVLMAAGSAEEAKRAAADTVRNTAEPRGAGDSLLFCWRFDELTVNEVEIKTLATA